MELMPHLKLPDNLGVCYAILPGNLSGSSGF